MSDVLITAGPFACKRASSERAPATCAAFEAAMPFISKIIHVRWSGAAVWIPLGDLDFGVDHEDAAVIRRQARSCFIPAASAKPRYSSPMAQPHCARPGSWPEILC